MVKFNKSIHSYLDPPATPLLAFFLRYPNPYTRHVLSVDVIDRYIDAGGRLHTKRLILKRGILPKWASQWLPSAAQSGGRGLDAWVIEDSVVDPPHWGTTPNLKAVEGEELAYTTHPRLRFSQGNLNHRKIMHVIESGELRAGPDGSTVHSTFAEVRSNLGGAWSDLIRSKIESYASGKFEANTETSRKGIAFVLESLKARQPVSDTADFYPPPPPSFSESWPIPPTSPRPVESESSRTDGLEQTEAERISGRNSG